MMELAITDHGGYVVVETEGPLDEHARTAFREQLHPLIGKAGTCLLIDLSRSPRINSPGVGNLVALVADANTQGSRVVLCNLTPFVAGVMSVTKLDTYFSIAPDVASAVAGLDRAATG
jgi:anti-sigma B factor antagonist